jgi:predicted acetyltransferase
MLESGQSVAALWASQAAIYQRYGYSLGSVLRSYQLDTADAVLLEAADPAYEVRRESAAESFDALRDVYRSFIADRTLYLHRGKLLWQANALQEKDADGPVHVALCRDPAGTPVGYAVYTLRSGRVEHPTRSQEIQVRDMAWLSVHAARALWGFLGRHDLVGRIVWASAAADDPAEELFVEPRLLNARNLEGVFFRVVDVAGALAARGYDSDGELTLSIAPDRETPWNEGTYRLSVSAGQASVERVNAAADVTFGIKTLSSAFTGFRRVRQLANWGLIDGDPAALELADRLFATRHAPHCPDHF